MDDNRSNRILVLDANQRSALAVTRSLGSRDSIEVTTADTARSSLAGSSRYSCNYLQCPSPFSEVDDFLAWVREVLEAHDFDAIFPVTEITSQLLLMNRTILGSCKLPFASYETVMSLANKGRLLDSAHSAGVPVPRYRLFTDASQTDVDDFSNFPLVVKPCLSTIWTGKNWVNTKVDVVQNRRELSQTLDQFHLRHYPFMIQEFVPGHGAGIFALYNHGKPVAYFCHRRVREKPPRGGVSVVSESVPLNDQLRRYAEALLTSVQWHGVAMIEFRVTEAGEPYLMEVNTRFWGSLQLAIDAGVDFPYLLWRLTAGSDLAMQERYRVGQRLRWLLGDLDSLYLTLKDREYSAWQKLARTGGFIASSFSPCRYEVNRWSDLRPAWHEMRCYLANLAP